MRYFAVSTVWHFISWANEWRKNKIFLENTKKGVDKHQKRCCYVIAQREQGQLEREKGEQMEAMNEKEIKIVKNSTIYEIRLAFASGEKEDYKKEEILEMLDKIALAKEQEWQGNWKGRQTHKLPDLNDRLEVSYKAEQQSTPPIMWVVLVYADNGGILWEDRRLEAAKISW